MSNKDVKKPSADELRRLALIRYLYSQGVEQSQKADPVGCLAILQFHDAAEAMLLLLSQRYDVGEKQTEFMQYWNLLKQKGIQVSEQESMRRLNAARVSLKHKGILPSFHEFEGFRASVTNFLYNCSENLLGVHFERLSLVQLVGDSKIREHLDCALEELERKNHQEAIKLAAISYEMILGAGYKKLKDKFPLHIKPLSQAVQISGFSLSGMEKLAAMGGNSVKQDVMRFTKDVERSINITGELIKAICLGFDLIEFEYFYAYRPFVYHLANGQYHVNPKSAPPEDAEGIRRCIDFVVNCAVKLRI